MNKQRWTMLLHNQVVAVVIALMLLVPALFAAPGAARAQQLTGYGLLGLVLFVVWLARTQDQLTWQRVKAFLFRGPNLAIIAYLGWNFISAATSKEPFYSRLALVQLAFGAVIYATVAYQFRHRSQVKALLSSLVIVGVILVIAALAMDPQHSFTHLAGAFKDPQLFGAFLMLQFPMVLAIAVGSKSQIWRITAQLSTILIAAALLMTGCRSSWLGALVALLVFGALGATYAWNSASLNRKKHEILVTPVLAIVVLGIFLYFMGMGQAVTDRVAAIVPGHISGKAGGPPASGAIAESAADRLSRNKIALSVWKESPITGVGLGTYALHQVAHNPASRPEVMIRYSGPSLSENPHNLYLQILAEQGVIGLALYLALIALFFVQGLRAMPRLGKGLRQYTLMGAMAAVAGQCVDGIANPGWGYPEVSTFMWLIMGVGMCAAGISADMPEESRSSSRSASVFGLPRFLFRGFRTALIGCLALWLGAQIFGIQALSASAGEKAGFGPGIRAGGSTGKYCASTDRIAVDFLNDNIPPPQAFAVTSGTYPLFGGAQFKVYGINNERPDFFFDDVTSEFATKRLKVRVTKAPGTNLGVGGRITFNRFTGAITYVPRKQTREPRTAILTFTYNCGAFGTFSTDFTLNIPGFTPTAGGLSSVAADSSDDTVEVVQ